MFYHIDYTNRAGHTTLFTIGREDDTNILARNLVSANGGEIEVSPVDLPRIQPGDDTQIHLLVTGAHFYECTLSLPERDQMFMLAGTLPQVEEFAKTLLFKDGQLIDGATFSLQKRHDRSISTDMPVIDTERALRNPANITLDLARQIGQ